VEQLKMPEISAKKYAEINNISRDKVNEMCANKDLPCRKIGTPPPEGQRDSRMWWVILAKIEELHQ
jgi:hypothetical protein